MSASFVKAPPTLDRILDALISCAADVGFAKPTMEDIAGRAELSRVTLYAYFPNKQAIVRAAVLRELTRFFAELESVSVRFADPDEQLVEVFAYAYRHLREHALVRRMVRSEPEILATYLARETPAIPLARDWVAGKLLAGGRLPAGTDPEHAAEFIVRAIHSLVIAPNSAFPLESTESARRYARRWVLPAVHGNP